MLAKGLSILAFDSVQLAFPVDEVLGVQPLSLIEPNPEAPLALGSITQGGRRWPVFGFSADFKLLSGLLAQHSYCVCLSADGAETGLALVCDTVNGVSLASGAAAPSLPVCLRAIDSPLRHWYQFGSLLVPISSAPALARYITRLMEQKNG